MKNERIERIKELLLSNNQEELRKYDESLLSDIISLIFKIENNFINLSYEEIENIFNSFIKLDDIISKKEYMRLSMKLMKIMKREREMI